jgi:hypothetical protein
MRPEDVPADVAEVLEAKKVVLAFGAFTDNASCVRRVRGNTNSSMPSQRRKDRLRSSSIINGQRERVIAALVSPGTLVVKEVVINRSISSPSRLKL